MTLNCIIIDDDELSIKMLTHLIGRVEELILDQSFQDPIEAFHYLGTHEVDLVFLDVEMPGMSGFEMLSTLREKPQVIFVSGKRDYALDAFEFDVTDYLLKPVQYSRFLKAIEKAQERVRTKESQSVELKGDFIFVKSDSMLVRVKVEDILWIEALADYIALVTEQKKYVTHSTMKSVEARLPKDQFLRVHRSYIVRLDRIDAIEDNTILIGKKMIPVGGTYRDALINALDFI